MADNDEGLHSGRFSIIPARVYDDPRVTPALLRLLGVLGTYGNKYGYCWPKLATVSERMGNVSKSAISQGLKKLHDFGYLEITPRYDQDGGRSTNMYRILFDTPLPELNSHQLPEVKGGLAPELNGGLSPELNTLNVPYERPILTSPTAAAATIFAREPKRAAPEAAAAEVENDETSQTAEACRRRLHMSQDKLDGLKLIVACWPGRRAWLETQAALCWDTLKVRPLKLNHFSNWLDTAEKRRVSPPEEMAHHDEPATATDTLPQAPADKRGPDGLTDAEREAVKHQLNALIARTVGPNTPG